MHVLHTNTAYEAHCQATGHRDQDLECAYVSACIRAQDALIQAIRGGQPEAVITHARLQVTQARTRAGHSPLGRAQYAGQSLRGRCLEGAVLRDANLIGTDLRGADLRGADLRDASLAGADLRGANLEGARLGGAHLDAADLRGACLWGVDLSAAIGAANAVLDEAHAPRLARQLKADRWDNARAVARERGPRPAPLAHR